MPPLTPARGNWPDLREYLHHFANRAYLNLPAHFAVELLQDCPGHLAKLSTGLACGWWTNWF